MFGLRQKITFGFGGMLAILLLVSGLGIAVTRQHRHTLDKFLFENWRSVEYGQKMIDALSHLDDSAKQIANDDRSEVNPDALSEFDNNYDAEQHNVTLKGEGDLVAQLTSQWKPYREAYLKTVSPFTSPTDRQAAFTVVQKNSPLVKSTAQSIVNLNLANMTPVEGRIKDVSDESTRLMIMLSVLGIALAIAFIAIVARSILQPLRTVTKSIREIAQGNLDLVVHVRSRDELRQLAEAFNSMAAKLREFRRTDQAKLQRTQRTTQLAVSSLPDAIAIVNPDGVIELSNENAQRLFQLTPGISMPQLRMHRLADAFRQVVQAQQPLPPSGYEAAIEVFEPNGQAKFFLPNAVPIRDAEKNLIGVTLVLADVTNLRRLDEMKSGLLSVVSHELKTPLTSIRMAVHLLLEERLGELAPKQTELLIAARDDSDRLEKIIADLLDMSRLESGGTRMDLQSESPARLINTAVSPLETSYHDRGVALSIMVPDDAPNVLADADRIDHVFTNLLTNALKFTDPGGKVTLSAATEENFVRFIVKDTGVGIPEEHLPRVFDRFFRVPRENRPSGAGLGLAIAKDIVEAHGGTIGVKSKPGEGSEFSFTLKRADRADSSDTGSNNHHQQVHHAFAVHPDNGR
jgi:signal transduction histidine kinase